jgi:hypothetical protein
LVDGSEVLCFVSKSIGYLVGVCASLYVVAGSSVCDFGLRQSFDCTCICPLGGDRSVCGVVIVGVEVAGTEEEW